MQLFQNIANPAEFVKLIFLYSFVSGCGFFTAGLIAAEFYKAIASISPKKITSPYPVQLLRGN